MLLKIVAISSIVLVCFHDTSAAGSSNHLVVSASSVDALDHDLSSVHPPIIDVGGLDPEVYTKEMSCLGYYGPLGPYGPLGVTGPVGTNLWNPSFWISGFGDWSDWTDQNHGPLSSDGPLGQTGPLNPTAYWVDLPATNDFGKQLQAGGVWAVLGPVGPLGALGPLGPLGPVGAHGYATDSKGNYVSQRNVIRTVDVDWDGNHNIRTYGLFENYEEAFAKTMTDNDASFMVSGSLTDTSDADLYSFSSPEDQYVTVVVMPEYAGMFYTQAMVVLGWSAMVNYESTFAPVASTTFDDFDLAILDGVTGQVLATSNTKTFVDFVTIQVPAAAKLQAKVTLKSSWHIADKYYRLFVTGSTKYINGTDIAGAHQLSISL